MTDIAVDFSGIRIVLRGLPTDFASRVRQEWNRFIVTNDTEGWLDVAVSVSNDQQPPGPFAHEMRHRLEKDGASYEIPEGSIEIDAARKARLRISAGDAGVRFYTLSNLIAAALAWSLPSRGAALVHGAGIVWKGHGFALVGPSSSGKTTWAYLARDAGATFLSDDLLFVDSSGPRAELLSTPIRADDPEPERPGRWPLVAILLPVHGDTARLSPARPLRAHAVLAANLPFTGESYGRDARLGAFVDRLLSLTPAYELTFAREDSFLGCLDSLLPAGKNR